MVAVTVLEPYYGGSHRVWADGYHRHSNHNITLLTMPAQAWKWRMQGGAVTLAREFAATGTQPDVILASDMMDLSIFRALTRHTTHNIPHALYFHENQLTYPQNTRQNHGWRYGFINYASAMSADALFFNSKYHMDVFFDTLPNMLKHFYDYNELGSVDVLREKASVLSVGMDLQRFNAHHTEKTSSAPLIIWNHRWEEDKNPHLFLRTLYRLQERGANFRVAIVGENIRHTAPEFEAARTRLREQLVHFGYLESFADYARLLWQADYVVSTANQEFFGISIVEAMYCGCIPILPRRLNYPHLVPRSAYDACLYRSDDQLLPLLQKHLQGELNVNRAGLHASVTQYDWSQIAPRYDAELSRLAQGQPPVPR
ncbi:MAG: DUF3524 domain-containing protein [Chloroflexota bacterium]